MYYVGLDVHQRRSSFCILDGNGKQVKRLEVKGGWDKLMQRIDQEVPRPFRVCFEASCGYGYLFDQLSRRAAGVVVGHPGQLRLIFRSKRKNDRVDCVKLSKLLYLEEVPQVHVPAEEVRAWRGMINYRRRLVNRRSAVKTQIRAFLRGLGQQAPSRLWTGKGQAWLAELELGEMDDLRREMMVEELAGLEERVKKVEKQLNRIGRKHPGVILLMTIPGVGPRTAEAFVAWIDRVDRFTKVNQFGTYLGLVPCQDASADKNRLGHITKDGPAALRWLVSEAAWQGIRRSPTLRGFYDRVMGQKADRKKIAIVATARHLVTVMGAMLKSGQVWREDPRYAHLAAGMTGKKQPGKAHAGCDQAGQQPAREQTGPGGASSSRLCAASWASPPGVKVPSHEYMGPCPPGGSTLTPVSDAGNGSGYEAGGAKMHEG